jgi:hypothetical protein
VATCDAPSVRARRGSIDLAFYVLSFFFACGAIFHSFAAAIPTIDPEAPAWRHLLFVGINLACIAGFLFRPLFFMPLFAVLAVQQIATHGSHAWHAFQNGALDAPSIGVVLVMPLTFVLLVIDARRKRRGKA